jgi:hypothetical protein
MFFDAVVQSYAVDVESKGDHVIEVFDLGIAIPTPQGGTGALPVGRLRMVLNRAAALEHAEKLRVAAEALPEPPKPSDLVVPSGIDVDKVAEELSKFKG